MTIIETEFDTTKSGHMNKFTCAILFALSLFIIVSPSINAVERKTGAVEELKVEIISLKEDERLHGNITIEARVNDTAAVKYCEFYIQETDAKDRYSWKDYSSPYFWGGDGQPLDTTIFDDGPVSAVAFCFPQDDQLAMFQKRVHFIIDNGRPMVKILSPLDKARINQNVSIKVDARDTKSIRTKAGIKRLSIYLDGALLKQYTTPPYQVELNPCLLLPGLHSIRAVAEDTEGLTGADTVIIEVTDQGSILGGK